MANASALSPPASLISSLIRLSEHSATIYTTTSPSAYISAKLEIIEGDSYFLLFLPNFDSSSNFFSGS